MRLKDTPKGANLVFLLTVLINIGLSFTYEILLTFGIDLFGGSFAVQLLVSQTVFIIPSLLYLLCTKTSFNILRFKKVDFLTILLCILLYFCISPVLNFVNLLSLLYSTNLVSNMMFGVAEEIPFVLGLILIAIVPAFLEEATYRGFFYNTYKKTSPLGAVLLCGLMFGLMHGNLNQFTYAFLLGMVFALIVEATDSLWSTVTVHFLVNTASVALIYLMPTALEFLKGLYDASVASGDMTTANMIVNALGSDDFSYETVMGLTGGQLSKADILASLGAYAIPAAIGAVLAFFLFRFIAKRCGRWEIIRAMFTRKSKKSATEPADIPLVPVKNKLVTWEFITGGVIMVIQMVFYEVAMRLLY